MEGAQPPLGVRSLDDRKEDPLMNGTVSLAGLGIDTAIWRIPFWEAPTPARADAARCPPSTLSSFAALPNLPAELENDPHDKTRTAIYIANRGAQRARCSAIAIVLLSTITSQAQTTLPDINVIATTPLSGTRSTTRSKPSAAPARPARTRAARAAPAARTPAAPAPAAPAPAPAAAPADASMIARDKVPSNTEVLTSAEFSHDRSMSFLDGLSQYLPGAFISDQTGNSFQRTLNYRGFVASPVQGTPQGLAVYQNGVRINEAYGDIVNWDFIPEMAIRRLSLVPNNPIFGLNAIGGALTIEMKNGFTYQGKEAETTIGSYGRRQAAAQVGYRDGNLAAYANADATNDNGWRDFSSSSQLRRMYVDVGGRNDTTEVHLAFTGADNKLGSVAATPIEMLSQRWSSVYTWPQGTHLQLAFVNASASYAPSDTLSFQSNGYYRGFWQSHTDGNGTSAQPCDPSSVLAGQLCIGDGVTPINVNYPVIDLLSPNSFFGEIDRNWTSTNSLGTVQATSSDKLFDHDNHFVMGMSLDRGLTQFTATSELGTIDQNLFVQGTGVYIDQPANDTAPVNLFAKNTYTGLYATDTLDVTSQLSVAAGARLNIAQIDLLDQTGAEPLINSASHYQRLNPVIGATYKFTPNVTGYAGYSEANRAPTPLELGCSSPTNPCIIDNFLAGDPPLKQVISHTYEAGLRGHLGANAQTGQIDWTLGSFYTLLRDDIINVAGVQPMTGYFKNAGNTLREGIEAKINYRWDHWTAYANYTYVNAVYRSALIISSPQDPFADANGNIFVAPGDHIPGIPAQRFKAGVEYSVTDAWKFGADVNYIGTQWLIHDDNNLNPKIPAYAVVNVHGSYQVAKNVEVFGLVNNLFNTHYYLLGTFFSTSGFNSKYVRGAEFLHAAKRSAHVGARHAARRLCRRARNLLRGDAADGVEWLRHG
jgi:iron complex outermembrane receptor protein